jgi:hypothetical protein
MVKPLLKEWALRDSQNLFSKLTESIQCVFKKFPHLFIHNIFLYLEVTKSYPLQNSPLAQQCTFSITIISFLEVLFEGCLWYHLQVIRHISDVFHCLKSSSFKGNFEFWE